MSEGGARSPVLTRCDQEVEVRAVRGKRAHGHRELSRKAHLRIWGGEGPDNVLERLLTFRRPAASHRGHPFQGPGVRKGA